MRRSLWLVALLIGVSIGGNIGEFLIHPLLGLAQSNGSQKAEAERLIKSGVAEYQRRNFQGALTLFQKALPLFRLIADRSEESATLSLIGLAYNDLGEYSKAIESYQQALVITRTLGNRQVEGDLVDSLGRAYKNSGQYRQAIESYQQALIISRELRDRSGEVTILNNLGTLYDNLGEYPKVIELYEQALKLGKELGDRSAQAATFNNLGAVYNNLGQYGKAIEYHQQSLAVNRGLNNSAGIGTSLNNLGLVYDNQGNYQEAIEYYQQSLTIIKKLGNQTQAGYIYNNLGAVYKRLGTYEKAIEYFQQALAISKELGNQIGEGTTLNNFAAVYDDAGRYPQAIEYYQRALKINQQLGNRAGEGAILNNLGGVYISLEQYPKAIESFRQALIIRKEIGDRAGEVTTLNNLGAAYDDAGQYSQAIVYYQQALEINKQIKNSGEQVTILSNLGRINYISNRLTIAGDYLQSSIEISDNLRTNLEDRDKISLFEKQQNIYKLLSLVRHRQGKFAESLIAAERGRTRAFQDRFIQKRNLPKLTPPTFTQLQSIAQQHQSTIVEYSIIPKFGKNDPRSQGELLIYIITPDGKLTVRTQSLPDSVNLDRLVAINRQNIINNIKSAPMPSDRTISTNPISLKIRQSVRLKIDPPTAPSRKIIKIDLQAKTVEVSGFGDEVVSDTVDIEQIILIAQAENNLYPPLQQLHKLLIAPIADLLPKNSKESVIFIPAGALFEVPFAALQDERGNYLIDKHTILTAPSLGVLAQTAKIQPQGKNALIVGNPTMPTPRAVYGESQLKSLGYSQTEASQIAKLYQTDALIGAQATEAAIKPQLANYRVIHLSTHGILNQQLVGESAIVLAAGGGEDGYLTVNEILDLKLNADLVVLSACDTGRGEIKGDGVIGLSRALMTGGTRSLIVSLWAVDDRSTSELMQGFYRQWREGKQSKAEALRGAMLAVRDKYPAPYHWAGMTLMGEGN